MKNVQTGNFSGETTECLGKSLPVRLLSFAKTATRDDLPSPKKDNCISSVQNTETEANICQNEDELSRDTTELKGDPKDVKEKKTSTCIGYYVLMRTFAVVFTQKISAQKQVLKSILRGEAGA